MATRIPKAVLTRKKRGFSNPVDAWLRSQLKGTFESRLIRGESPLFEWMDPRVIRSYFEEHASGRHDRRRQLFLLLTLDAWARAFL